MRIKCINKYSRIFPWYTRGIVIDVILIVVRVTIISILTA